VADAFSGPLDGYALWLATLPAPEQALPPVTPATAYQVPPGAKGREPGTETQAIAARPPTTQAPRHAAVRASSKASQPNQHAKVLVTGPVAWLAGGLASIILGIVCCWLAVRRDGQITGPQKWYAIPGWDNGHWEKGYWAPVPGQWHVIGPQGGLVFLGVLLIAAPFLYAVFLGIQNFVRWHERQLSQLTPQQRQAVHYAELAGVLAAADAGLRACNKRSAEHTARMRGHMKEAGNWIAESGRQQMEQIAAQNQNMGMGQQQPSPSPRVVNQRYDIDGNNTTGTDLRGRHYVQQKGTWLPLP
jgi:hypothetical protein